MPYLLPCLFVTLAAAQGNTAKPPAKLLPTLATTPKLDGNLKDLNPAAELKGPPSVVTPSAGLKVKAAFKKDTLWVGVQVTDDQAATADELSISLFFPGAGPTAHGHIFRFNREGALPTVPEALTPAYAVEAVKVATRAEGNGFTLEAAFPFKSLPRFPARAPLAVHICAEYVDDDQGPPMRITTCPQGDMVAGPVRLPDEMKKVLKISPPAEVEALQPRANGVVGYAELQYPTWGYTDGPMTPTELRTLISDQAALDPAKIKLPISDSMMLPDQRPLYAVLTGQDPYTADQCNAEQEVRLAMYGIKANVAQRVLEWPAITCGLGRAVTVQLSPEGHLQIGYSTGTVANFIFSNDHFERSELGTRP